jgi:hypothetical protein
MNRKTLVTGTIAGAIVCTLVLACSSSTPPSVSPPNDDPTPPGTTPVTSAPYAVCTTLEPGSFTTSSSYAVPTTASCSPAGEPGPVTATNLADAHCVGVTPQTVNGGSCSIDDAGPTPSDDSGAAEGDAGDAGVASEDAGPLPTPGPCDENGIDGAYGSTMYGTEGDDDDCKYHVSYTVSPICENKGTYFVVTANYLAGSGAVLTGASTFAELCLNDTHPAPTIDSRPPSGSQQVVEGPPGTYTVGPVQFDAPGDWTVRFHFNEFCCDVADDSPHGHAAFHVTVP